MNWVSILTPVDEIVGDPCEDHGLEGQMSLFKTRQDIKTSVEHS